MSRIIYYIGAGASYGQKEARETISIDESNKGLVVHEGLPIVSEIAPTLLAFCKAIEDTNIQESVFYQFKGLYNTRGSDLLKVKQMFVDDIKFACNGTKEHATIDTFARKLFLTRRYQDFKKLKNVLSVFFVWQQIYSKPDQRYDTFLANVLSQRNLYFPNEISVISWNYDSQFELAYNYYSYNGNFPIYDKNREKDWPNLVDYGRIFKVNGSATFGDFSAVNDILKDNTLPHEIQLIIYYGDLMSDTSSLGFQLKSHLSFAWEVSEQNAKMMQDIQQTVNDTESVVVIGYSFPYFNRQIDRTIFQMMRNLRTIYIQDINPKSVEWSLKAVLPEEQVLNIERIDDCSQFYLPKEL